MVNRFSVYGLLQRNEIESKEINFMDMFVIKMAATHRTENNEWLIFFAKWKWFS